MIDYNNHKIINNKRKQPTGKCSAKKRKVNPWSNFLRYLKERGLKGVKLVISDKAAGLADALGDFFPETQWQRCVVHWYRNAFNNANTAAMRHQDFLQQLPL